MDPCGTPLPDVAEKPQNTIKRQGGHASRKPITILGRNRFLRGAFGTHPPAFSGGVQKPPTRGFHNVWNPLLPRRKKNGPARGRWVQPRANPPKQQRKRKPLMQRKTCDMSSVATEEMSSFAKGEMSSVATETCLLLQQ